MFLSARKAQPQQQHLLTFLSTKEENTVLKIRSGYRCCFFVKVDKFVYFGRREVGGLQYFLHEFLFHGSALPILWVVIWGASLAKEMTVKGKLTDSTGLKFMLIISCWLNS